MSDHIISIMKNDTTDELAKITPFNSPIVNENTNPRVHTIEEEIVIQESFSVANRPNTLVPSLNLRMK